MKVKYIWAAVILVIGYGFSPVSMSYFKTDFDKPNTLLIERQECGCPCAQGVITKGVLEFTADFKEQYPNVKETREITLTNFFPFDRLDNSNTMIFDFANSNTFKVTGQVIGVDTILCNPTDCEIIPKFEVSKWATTTYYPRFWLFGKPIFAMYWGTILLILPTLTIITIIRAIRKK